jgi:hypothetical protein
MISSPQDEHKNYRHGACSSEKKLPVHKKLCAITRILLSGLNLSLVQGRVANIGPSVLLNGYERCGAATVAAELAQLVGLVTFWRRLERAEVCAMP